MLSSTDVVAKLLQYMKLNGTR